MNILSGSTHLRFNSRLNHACYAALHGYGYVFDTTPRPLGSVYDHKLRAILDLPLDDEWWFWIDDDAFFTQFSRGLGSLELPFDDKLLIFPKSPVNPQGGWTFLSSGNFFFRNCAKVREFFAAALEADLSQVKQWWDVSRFGMFTHGDQDKIVWQLSRDAAMSDATQLVAYEIFNTRPYHFQASASEQFLVHFAVPNETKIEGIRKFQARFNFRTDALIPEEHQATADSLRHFVVDATPQEKRRWWRFA